MFQQEYTSGTFDIQVGSSFTVNVTPAKGYKVGNISYNDADYNNGEAITAVKDVTDIAVTVAVDTVNVDFTKLNNATINVSYTNDKATSATAEITADTTLAMQNDTEFTVTVTLLPIMNSRALHTVLTLHRKVRLNSQHQLTVR